MVLAKRVVEPIDRWQRKNPIAGPGYGVVKKFGDDQAGTLVVALGWYGFLAIYPLLLVVVSIFGYIGAASLGHSVVSELHKFPVIGDQFKPAGGGKLHGSAFALVVGLAGLTYGSLGVTNTAQQIMAKVWDVPQAKMPSFLPKLARSLVGLIVIGGAFLVTAVGSSLAGSSGQSWAVRIPVALALVVANIGFYLAAFHVLTPKGADAGSMTAGAIAGGVAFTALTVLGTSLVQHQLRNTSATYGALGSIIGVVVYLLLLAKLSIYAAELNPVLRRRLWPRALPTGEPTRADELALQKEEATAELARAGSGPTASGDTARDAGAVDRTARDAEEVNARARA
jgi:uncharacterized BrkB/YihY/UPF0761 family membrane protein